MENFSDRNSPFEPAFHTLPFLVTVLCLVGLCASAAALDPSLTSPFAAGSWPFLVGISLGIATRFTTSRLAQAWMLLGAAALVAIAGTQTLLAVETSADGLPAGTASTATFGIYDLLVALVAVLGVFRQEPGLRKAPWVVAARQEIASGARR